MDMQAQLMLAAQYGWGPGPDSGQPGGTIQVQITLQVFFPGFVCLFVYFAIIQSTFRLFKGVMSDFRKVLHFYWLILYLCYDLLKS